MCDFEEGELAEYLLYLEAARVRAAQPSKAVGPRDRLQLPVAPAAEPVEA
jgi:hypothetical protein